jgi:hypothetical protein
MAIAMKFIIAFGSFHTIDNCIIIEKNLHFRLVIGSVTSHYLGGKYAKHTWYIRK